MATSVFAADDYIFKFSFIVFFTISSGFYLTLLYLSLNFTNGAYAVFTLKLIVISSVLFNIFSWSCVSSALFVIRSVKDLFSCFLLLATSTLLLHLVAVIYGAPLLESALETFLFALLLDSVTFLPCSCILQFDWDKWRRVFLKARPEFGAETMVYYTSLSSFLGAWLGAFPIPLDWDRTWQVWPISCVAGTLSGYIVGLVIAACSAAYQTRQQRKHKDL